MVVSEKKAVNLSIPVELLAILDEIAGRLKGKQKWMVPAAGLILLLECPAEIQDFYLRQMRAVEAGLATMDDIILRARSGDLRHEAEVFMPRFPALASPGLEKNDQFMAPVMRGKLAAKRPRQSSSRQDQKPAAGERGHK